jgi:hypothetical protein
MEKTLVTSLNLIWLLLVAGALAAVAWAEQRRSFSRKKGTARRVGCVLLVAISLFPFVSASDDLIAVAYLHSTLQTRNGWGHSAPEGSKDTTHTAYLARQLQSLENLQVAAFFKLFFSLCYFGLVFLALTVSHARHLPSQSSRAPPSTLLTA